MKKRNIILLTVLMLCILCGKVRGQTTNNLCLNALPFCTDENPYGVTFPAGTNSTATPDLNSSQRGCLYYTPAPAWFVMQIDQPGDMLIYMDHSNGRDIDFACWGPFTGYTTYGELLQAVCTSQLHGGSGTHRPSNGYHDPNNTSTWGGYPSGTMIDCSYSAASSEWCFIPHAQVGEWYIFLICNYSRASGNIHFDRIQTDHFPATTNCNILVDISNNGPLCEGEDLQLYCNAYSQNGYRWYHVDAEGNQIGTWTSTDQNPLIPNVTADMGGTYRVYFRPANHSSDSYGETDVVIYPRPSAEIHPSSEAVCNGTPVRLDGISDCATCNFQWSNGSTQHSINPLPTTTTTYSLTVSNENCSSVVTQTIVVGSMPTVAVSPAVVTLCSALGSVDLEAVSFGCGYGCTYEWSNGANTQVITITNGGSYTVTATNSYGCTAEATSYVSRTDNPDISDCNVFYADNYGDPESNGLTPSQPTTIQHAIELATCTNAIIRLDTGQYRINRSIKLASNLTVEGGFFDDYKQKTSRPGATTIYRTADHVEGTEREPRIVAMEGSSLNNFRLQDLTLQTADAPDLEPVRAEANEADDKDCFNEVLPGVELAHVGEGNVNDNVNNSLPSLTIPGQYLNHRSMMLYTASELAYQGLGANVLTAIGFDVKALTPQPNNADHPRFLRMYLKEVGIGETEWEDIRTPNNRHSWSTQLNGASLVYEGYICVEGTGRLIIPINFEYSGEGGILVMIEGQGCYESGVGGCGVTLKSSSASNMYYRPGNTDLSAGVPTMPTSLAVASFRPNIFFYGCNSDQVEGTVIATVGNGASTGTFPLPGANRHHRTVALYGEGEIHTGARMLSGISFEVNSIAPVEEGQRTRTVRIYMKNTSDLSLNANQTWNQCISNSSLVYSGTMCAETPGWISFPTDFAYEGHGLLVMIDGEGCDVDGGCTVETFCENVSGMCISYTTNSGAYSSINRLQAVNLRPNIRLLSNSTEEGDFYVSASNYGVSTYALHLTTCNNYDIVRCQFIPGDGGDGKDGLPGKNGGDGGAGGDGGKGTQGIIFFDGLITTNFTGTAPGVGLGGVGGVAGAAGISPAGIAYNGGAGGNGGQYDSENITCNAGHAGADGAGNALSGLAGHNINSASTSTAGVAQAQALLSSMGSMGQATAGSNGLVGASHTQPNLSEYSEYFQPGAPNNGANGTAGTGGGGGGGGGAAYAQNIYTADGTVLGFRRAFASGNGGGGGGGGGAGGQGGGGGYGGGGSFGIYLYNDQGGHTFLDCYSVPGHAGSGGLGAEGGQGGQGGAGGSSDPSRTHSEVAANGSDDFKASAYGGLGDHGGDGGNGGAGGHGANGPNGAIYMAVTVTQNNIATALADFSNWGTLIQQPTIVSGSHNNPYTSCTDVNMDMCGDVGLYSSFGSNASPSSGTPCTNITYSGTWSDLPNQPTGIGRKTPQADNNRYSGFNLVLFSPISPDQIVGNQDVCPGENSYCLTYDSVFNVNEYFYSWSVAAGQEFAQFISDPTLSCVNVEFTNTTNEYQTVILHVDVSPPCCPSFEYREIEILLHPMVNVTSHTGEVFLCTGEDTVLSVTATPLDATYQWLLNGNAIAGATSNTYEIHNVETVTAGIYSAVVSGYCNAEEVEIPVTLYTMPEVSVVVDEAVCKGDPVTLIFESNIVPVDVYFTVGDQDYMITITDPSGEYVYEISEGVQQVELVTITSVTDLTHGCENDDQVQDVIEVLNSDGSAEAGQDRNFCSFEFDLEAVEPGEDADGNPQIGQWTVLVDGNHPLPSTPNIETPNNYATHVSVTAAGEYYFVWTVSLGSPCGGEVTDTLAITVEDSVHVHFNRDLTSCFGEDIDLTATATGGEGPYDYYWLIDVNGNGILDENDTVFYSSASAVSSSVEGLHVGTSYHLVVDDSRDCSYDTTFVITILESQDLDIQPIDTVCPNAQDFEMVLNIANGSSPFNVTTIFQGQSSYQTGVTEFPYTERLPFTVNTCDQHDTIYVVVEDANGCVARDTATVVIADTRAPEIQGTLPDMEATCPGDTLASATTIAALADLLGQPITDNCCSEANLQLSVETETFTALCNATYIRTYTVSDTCGNASTVTQRIILHDEEAPTIDGTLSDTTIYAAADCRYTAVTGYETVDQLVSAGLTITDCNLSQEVTFADDDDQPLTECQKEIIRTYTISDSCGNSNTIQQHIIVLDSFPPVVNTVLTDTILYYIDAQCNHNDVAVLELTDFDVVDCNDVNLAVTHRDTLGAPGDCEWSFIRDYRFTDACGNGPTIVSQNIIIRDTARPQVVDNLTDTILYYVGNDCTAPELPRLELSDFTVEDCRSGNIQLTVTEQDTTNNGEGCSWSYMRVYTFTDDCNNAEVSISQQITIMDTTRPLVTGTLPDITLYRLPDCSYDLPAELSITDLEAAGIAITDCNLDDVVTAEDADLDGDNCEATIVRTYRISDLCGNFTTIAQNIIIRDTLHPYLSEEIADSLLTAENCEFVVPDFVSIARDLAQDNCTAAADMEITQSVAPGTAVTGEMDVTITVADACGNDTTYTVHLSLPEELTIELNQTDTSICEGQSVTLPTSHTGGTAPYAYVWVPADGLNVANADTVVATPAHGTYNYEVTITDANGCTATAAVQVTVDTLPAVPTLTPEPNVACHGDANGSITVENPVGEGYEYSLDGETFQTAVIFENLTDSTYVVTVLNTQGCQSEGTTVVERSPAIPAVAIDSLEADLLLCPNQGTQEITARILNGLAPYTVTWTGAEVTVADSLAATVAIEAGHCDTSYIVTVSIVDGNECEAHSTYSFGVADTIAPVIVGEIPQLTIACANDVPAEFTTVQALLDALTGDATSITDNCTTLENLTLLLMTDDFVQSCNYQIVRNYSVSDECGNTTEITHIISVHDTIAPVITGTLAEQNVVCVAEFTEPATTVAGLLDLLEGDAAISDNCSAVEDLSLTVETDEFTSLCSGTYHRTYTVADTCGNFTTITQNLIVNDNVAPDVVGTLPDTLIFADSSCLHSLPNPYLTVDELIAVGLDITDCNLVTDVTFEDADMEFVNDCRNLVVRTYTVSDSCSNTTTIQHNIYIQDTIRPWLASVIADTLLTGVNCEFQIPDLENVVRLQARDNCTATGDIVITQSPLAGEAVTAEGDVTVTLEDACGLQSSFTVHLLMPTLPEITINQIDTAICEGQSVTLAAEAQNGVEPYAYSWTPTESLDDPTSATVVATPVRGTYEFVVEVTDANGCASTDTVIVEVDTIPAAPQLSQEPNAACGGDANGSITIEAPLGTGYSYSLNDAQYQDTTNQYTGLLQGPYAVTVLTDALAGCSASATIEVENDPRIPTIRIDSILTDLCPNQGTQIVTAQILNGAEPFVITWENAVMDAVDSLRAEVAFEASVCDSNYSVTVRLTDANECETFYNYQFRVADSLAPVMADFVDTVSLEGCDVTVAPDEFTTEDQLTEAGMSFTDECTQAGHFIVHCEADTAGTCPIVITRRYTVEDECGHVSNAAVQRVLIHDETAPAVTVSERVDTLNACGAQDARAAAERAAQLIDMGFEFTDACTQVADMQLNLVADTTYDGCTVDIIRHYTVSDACGNTSDTMTHTIRIHDSIAPVITGTLSDVTFYGCDTTSVLSTYPVATTAAELLVLGEIEIEEACTAPEALVVHSSTDSTSLCEILVTRTYWLEDACGNLSNQVTQTIHILDTVAPVVTVTLTDTTLYYTNAQCEYEEVPQLTMDFFNPQDCHSVEMTVSQHDTVGMPGDCEWSFVRDYAFTDVCGNGPVVFSQTITVKDTMRPQVVDPLRDTILYYGGNDCTLADLPRLTLADFEVEDCRYAHLQFSVNEQDTTNNGAGCEWSYVRVYTFADDCNNTAVQFDQVVTIKDTTRPAIAGTLADVTIYRLADCQYQLPDTLSLQDLATELTISDCNLDSNSLVVSHSEITGDACNAEIVRTYTISDLCQNTNSISQTISIQDTTRPYLTETIPDSLLTATGCDFVVPDYVAIAREIAQDNCTSAADMQITQSIAAGTSLTEETDVTITLTDACNNSISYTVHLTLPEELVVALHQTDTSICEGQSVTLPTTFTGGTAPFTYAWSPTDGLNASDADTVVAMPVRGVYDYVVTITDGNGCTSTATVQVTVDTLPAVPTLTSEPNVACHGDANGTITVELPTGTGYQYSLDGENFQSAVLFENLTDSSYVVTVQNAEGCQSEGAIVVERSPAIPAVSIDSLAADLLLCPNQGSQELTARILNGLAPFEVTWTGAEQHASDSLAATVTVNANQCDTSYVVTVSILDGNGCEAHNTYSINISDTVAPVIVGEIPQVVIACANDVPAEITTVQELLDSLSGDATSITDNCTSFNNLTLSLSTEDFVQSCDYQIVRNYSVIDECGNTSTITHIIMVRDTIAPVVSGTLADQTVVCVDEFTAAVTTVAELRDLLEGDVDIHDNCCDFDHLTLQAVTDSFTALCNASYVRTYTVLDSCGNATSITQNLIIRDVTAPVVEGSLADTTLFADSTCNYVLPLQMEDVQALTLAGLTITDCNLQNEVSAVDADATEFDNCTNLVVRTYTVSDSCGNSTEIVQNIYIQDTVRPWLRNAIADTLLVSENCVFVVPDFEAIAAALAMDNCTAANEINVAQSVPAGTVVDDIGSVTITLTDGCGNTQTYVVRYSIPDELEIAINHDDTSFCQGGSVQLPTIVTGGTRPFTYSWTPETGLDDAQSSAPTATPTQGVYNYEVAVADSNGCTATAEVMVTVWEKPDTVSTVVSPNTLCEDGFNGEIVIEAPVGEYYSYSMDNGDPQTSPVFAGLASNTYTIVVHTQDGCVSDPTTVFVPNADNMPHVSIIVPQDTVCPNSGVQVVVAEVTGGVGPYYYEWQCGSIFDVREEEADVQISPTGCDTSYLIVVEVIDSNNCVAFTQVTIAAVDLEPPFMSGPTDTVVVDGCSVADIPAAAATVSELAAMDFEIEENCSDENGLVVSVEEELQSTCPIVFTRTYTLTDECGLQSEPLSQVFVVRDDDAPVAESPEIEEEFLGCGAQDAPAVPATVAELSEIGFGISDNCSDLQSLTFTYTETVSGTCGTSIERRYVVSDTCHNVSDTLVHYIYILDDEAPVISGAVADVLVDACDTTILENYPLAQSLAELQALGFTVSDNCTLDSVRVFGSQTIDGQCPITVTRSFYVQDGCGNQSNVATYHLLIQDTIPPVITDLITEQLLTSDNCVFVMPDLQTITLEHATDNCTPQNELTYTQQPAAGTVLTTSQVLTVTVQDACSMQTQATVNILLPDSLQIAVNEEDTSFCGGVSVSLSTTVAGGMPQYEYAWTPASGLDVTDQASVTATPVAGNYAYIVTVTDANGCQAADTVNVTAYEIPADAVAELTPNTMCAGVPNGAITITSPVGDDYEYSLNGGDYQSEVLFDSLSAGEYTLQVRTVHGCLSGIVTVQVDDELVYPTVDLSAQDNLTSLCPNIGDRLLYAVATGGHPDYVYQWSHDEEATTDQSTISIDPIHCDTAYRILVRVEDAHHCIATDSITLTVVDNSLPFVTGSMGVQTYEGCDASDAPAAYTTANQLLNNWFMLGDNCTSAASLSVQSRDSIVGHCPIIIYRFYTVTDECGNVSEEYRQELHVLDQTRPTVNYTTITTDVVGCSAEDAPAVVTTPADLAAIGFVFSDNCTPNDSLVVTCTADTTQTFCPQIIHRTYVVTDECGNSRGGMWHDIQIFDSVAPVLGGELAGVDLDGCDTSVLANYPAAATPAELIALGATILEECSDVDVFSEISFTGECPIVVTRTYWVVDSCGNESNRISQFINIQDTTAPNFTDAIPEQSLTGLEGHFYVPDLTDLVAQYVADNCTNAADIRIEQRMDAGTQITHDEQVVVVIYDNCNNADSTEVSLILPEVLQIDIVQDDARFCFGNSIELTPTVSGGSAPYTFTWTPNDGGLSVYDSLNTTATPDPGTHQYWVTVTDVNGSTATDSITIIVDSIPAQPQLASTGNTICLGDPNGTITIVSPLGNGYSYSLNGADYQTEPSYAGLASGTYTVMVQTAEGCFSDPANIDVEEQTAAPTITIVPTVDTLCPNVGTYLLTAQIAGGLAPFTYSWEGNGVENQDSLQTNLQIAADACNQMYVSTIHVTDANNCSSQDVDTIYVRDTEVPTITGNLPVVTYNGCTETAAPAAVQTPDGLVDLGLTLNDNCTAVDALVVSSRDEVEGSCPIVIRRYYTVTDACGNESAEFVQTLQVFDSVAPVVQAMTISLNVNGCTVADAPAQITAPADLLALGFEFSDNCTNIDDLVVTCEADTDGICPITIIRVYALTDECGNTTDGLVHYIQIHDSIAPVINGTIAAQTVDGCTLDAIANMPMAATVADLTALGVTITETCSYDEMTLQSGETVTYGCPITVVRTYTVTDECGNVSNEVVQTIVIQDTTAPVFNAQVDEHLLASENCQFVVPDLTEEVRAVASDNCTDNANLQIAQTPAANTAVTADMLVTVTVADSCGNTSSMQIQLRLPDVMTVDIQPSTTQYCEWDAVQLTAVPAGGNGDYTYVWTPATGLSSTTAAIVEVNTEALNYTYHLVVTDGNGCSVEADYTLPEPSHLRVTVAEQSSINCFGGNDGVAAATAVNGVEAYAYAWSNGATTAVNSNLAVGTYSVTVTDVYGCTATAEITLEQPTQQTLTENSTTDLSCFQSADGQIVVDMAGGTAPYSLTVNGTDHAQSLTAGEHTINSLAAGTYTMVLTDANNCSVTLTSTLNEPGLLTLAQQDLTPITCNGGADGTVTVAVAGGTADYTLTIDGAQTQTLTSTAETALFTGMGSGDHVVSVTDAHGCITTLTVNFIEPEPMSTVVNATTDVLCNGESNGTATFTISGGTLPYTVSVDPTLADITLNSEAPYTISVLWANTYNVAVTDARGCTAQMQIVINQPDVLAVTAQVVNNVQCAGNEDGNATCTVTGGTAPYTYAWSNGDNIADLNDVWAGTYTLNITDANGCTATANVEITEPEPLTVELVTLTESCNGAATAMIEVAAAGGTVDYQYDWSNAAQGAEIQNLAVGPYTVTVTDANGCSVNLTVEVPFHPMPDFTIATTPSYCERADGTATVHGTNLDQYTYDWHADNNPNTPVNNELLAGDYFLTVDDGVCTADYQFHIDNVPGPSANFTADPVTFIEGATVRYHDFSSGSIETWSYDFGDGDHSSDESPLHYFPYEGSYWTTLTVTDEHNCFDTAMLLITVIPDVVIYIPNAFTPNEDGLNDVWLPVLTNYGSEFYELIVYSRWGEVMFKSNDPNVGWNGRHNGKEAPVGVYTYVITYENLLNQKHMKDGTVTLVR